MIYIMYNPLAGNSTCEETCRSVGDIFSFDEKRYIDLLSIDDLEEFIRMMKPEDQIIICGGDGTLNYLINSINTAELEQDIFYYPGGSGNDFYHDVDEEGTNGVYRINMYLKCIPTVKVKGMEKLFINGIGFGIDGYCCEEGDKKRVVHPGKRVNYSIIALKGLAYDFKRVNAKVTVDGVTKEFKDVWMAPTMNGRFYGGGMMCAPNQDRMNEDGLVSVLVVHTKFRLLLLMAFASVFKGKHVKYTKLVTEMFGSDVKVEFDRPTALQIDGETVTDVTEYEVHKDKKIIC
ncbi:MAG: diacylglycerol kinase family protein [Lachnospiraceae bacterium]|nr:diacylglycerol kinase family protein [Lachnospiraceae bacterium]